MIKTLLFLPLLFLLTGVRLTCFCQARQQPNIIVIYTDDLGYGDLSCYGATKVHTPHVDRLAAEGLGFTNGHCAAATCTPSRYSLLTGQ